MPETTFFDSIDRPDIKDKITEKNPWAYFSLEAGLSGLSFEGGLGILAGDMYLQARKSGIPFILITLLYPTGWEQNLENFYQKEHYFPLIIDESFKEEGQIEIKANGNTVPVRIYTKKEEKTTIIGLYEPGLRELYADTTSSEHRMFQEAVLGFGGYYGLKKLGFAPSIVHLNEAATVFSLLAFIDDLITSGITLDDAIKKCREISVFTNHTLVQAAVASFSKEFYEKYVLNNIQNPPLKDWLVDLLKKHGDTLRRTTIAIELSGHLNGVSSMHAAIANMDCKTVTGDACTYKPITNGVYLERWTHNLFHSLAHNTHLLDEFDMPQEKFAEMTTSWTQDELVTYKHQAKKELNEYLKTRIDQYGNPIRLNKNAKIAVWAKRFAGYKRPDMLFSNTQLLLDIIEREDLYIFLSGSVHPGDDTQKQQLKSILSAVDANPLLREKVFYIQRYDIPLAQHLVRGADIWLNIPEVGKEACGTSWMKAIANNAILVSTKDGGVSDIADSAYLLIHGETFEDEVNSMYDNIEKACVILNDKEKWRSFITDQLKQSLHIISSARMVKDYLNMVFSK